MESKKKLFPKLKKKLRGFLTDESGKISKKDALGLSIGAMLLMGSEEVVAAHSSLCAGHWSAAAAAPVGAPGAAHQSSSAHGNSGTFYSSFTPTHGSWIVNGHYSWLPWATWAWAVHANGASHGSHGSHGSHCNGSRW